MQRCPHRRNRRAPATAYKTSIAKLKSVSYPAGRGYTLHKVIRKPNQIDFLNGSVAPAQAAGRKITSPLSVHCLADPLGDDSTSPRPKPETAPPCWTGVPPAPVPARAGQPDRSALHSRHTGRISPRVVVHGVPGPDFGKPPDRR